MSRSSTLRLPKTTYVARFDFSVIQEETRHPQGRGERSTTDVPPAPSITESNILGDVTNITRRVGEP